MNVADLARLTELAALLRERDLMAAARIAGLVATIEGRIATMRQSAAAGPLQAGEAAPAALRNQESFRRLTDQRIAAANVELAAQRAEAIAAQVAYRRSFGRASALEDVAVKLRARRRG